MFYTYPYQHVRKFLKRHCEFFWLNRHQLMKQFLVMLVFTLGKEYRVRHRVLCVVVGVFSFNCYYYLFSMLSSLVIITVNNCFAKCCLHSTVSVTGKGFPLPLPLLNIY